MPWSARTTAWAAGWWPSISCARGGAIRCSWATPAIDAVHSLATRKVPFDALFACSDLLAMGAIRAVQELGRKVPDDVSVVGYDDMPMAAAFQPALSSVRQDWQAGGSLLAQKMLALIRGEVVDSQVLPVSLMVRAT